MKLRLDATEIDLGIATTFSGSGPEIIQTRDRTSGGKLYTQTWLSAIGSVKTFTFDRMTGTRLALLLDFHETTAQGSRNVFEVEMDDLSTFDAVFTQAKITFGNHEMEIHDGTWQDVYPVSFEVEEAT